MSTTRDVEQAVVRGSELLKQGRLDDAQKVFRAALALDTDNARVLALLGLSHFRAGQFAEARPIYEQLVERTPTDASHRLNLGLVYLKLGDSDHAISALEASRALDPSQGRAVSYLGLAYARAGRYAEAYRSFLLAGQNDLASEIVINLTQAERDGIHAQLQRTGLEPAIARTRTPPPRPPPGSKPPPQDDIITQPMRPVEAPGIAIQSAAVIHMPKLDPDPEPEPSSSMEIFVERHAEPPPPPPPPPPAPVVISPAHELHAPRMTDSLQFVLPSRDAVPTPAAGQSMISQAVAQASPSQAATAASQARIAIGSVPPIPLSQLATDELVRPEDGDHPLEVSASGALVIRVAERVMTRLDGVHVTGGDLAFEPAQRRSRGHQTDDRFDYGGSPLHAVSGRGYLIALPGERVFTAVTLDDDIFYLREDLVFAFQASLRWENGNVPGLRGRFPVVQFRGDGSVALRSGKPLVRVKLPANGVLFVDATRLAGWIGRVIPRAVVPPAGGPMGEVCVECTGEGVVLIDPVGDQHRASGLGPLASGEQKPAPAPTPTEAKLDLGDDTF